MSKPSCSSAEVPSHLQHVRIGKFLCVSFLFWRKAVGVDFEADRERCARGREFLPAREAFDLNKTFAPIVAGEAFAELEPKVLSTDPWIVYFAKFMSEAEVQSCERHLFASSREKEFKASAAGGNGNHPFRYSETAFCIGECDEHQTVQTLRGRASSIVNVPVDNFDLSQALRYKQSMFYKPHHDNHPSFHFGPAGARIFTYFVYLSDDGLKGGDTYFPSLNLRAPAKRGAAVLFVNTKDRSPMETDRRTLHESLPVTGGEKRGMNMWLYQYNYRHFWMKGCTAIELCDGLGGLGKAAVKLPPQVIFFNHAKKATIHIFAPHWANRGYEDEQIAYEKAAHVGSVEPGGSRTVESAEGQVLLVRTKRKGGKLLLEYPVNGKSMQKVNLGKRPKRQQETEEL